MFLVQRSRVEHFSRLRRSHSSSYDDDDDGYEGEEEEDDDDKDRIEKRGLASQPARPPAESL